MATMPGLGGRTGRGLRAALVMFTVFVVARSARADDVRVQYFTHVSAGERPRLRLEARAPIGRLTVELVRDDGVPFNASFPMLNVGQAQDVPLGDEPGHHKYTGRIVIDHAGATRENTLSFETVVSTTLQVTIDKSKVDLAARRLEVQSSRPPARVDITVHANGGDITATKDVSGRAAGDALVVTWPPVTGDVVRIDLRVTDVDGFYQSLALLPWSVFIPHEEVTFATGSAEIAPSERPKLDASFTRISDAIAAHRELGAIKLFIAGHTDTVGDAASNLRLSLDRARAIANDFRGKGVKLPIEFEGFGESAPLVATPDNTDEPRNRRVDYILALDEPALKATGFKATWKVLRASPSGAPKARPRAAGSK